MKLDDPRRSIGTAHGRRRTRFFWASVVPFFADAETGKRIDGVPAEGQKWKLVWPAKGSGLTYRKYPNGYDRRVWRKMLREFPIVEAV